MELHLDYWLQKTPKSRVQGCLEMWSTDQIYIEAVRNIFEILPHPISCYKVSTEISAYYSSSCRWSPTKWLKRAWCSLWFSSCSLHHHWINHLQHQTQSPTTHHKNHCKILNLLHQCQSCSYDHRICIFIDTSVWKHDTFWSCCWCFLCCWLSHWGKFPFVNVKSFSPHLQHQRRQQTGSWKESWPRQHTCCPLKLQVLPKRLCPASHRGLNMTVFGIQTRESHHCIPKYPSLCIINCWVTCPVGSPSSKLKT